MGEEMKPGLSSLAVPDVEGPTRLGTFADLMATQTPEAMEAVLQEISREVFDEFAAQGFAHLYTPDQYVAPLRRFLSDNSDKTPEELDEMAAALTPGSVHNNCLVLRLAMSRILLPCPYLRAAVIARTWEGGKVGFQHMPSPLSADPDEYEYEGDNLIELLSEVMPTRILSGEDRAFYDALPERFVVYRGCSGISPEMAGLGLCWTTRRDIAEWFALRRDGREAGPVLLSAWVRKRDILLAFAGEHEVAVRPWRWRELKCRRRADPQWRPVFQWQSEATGTADA